MANIDFRRFLSSENFKNITANAEFLFDFFYYSPGVPDRLGAGFGIGTIG